MTRYIILAYLEEQDEVSILVSRIGHLGWLALHSYNHSLTLKEKEHEVKAVLLGPLEAYELNLGQYQFPEQSRIKYLSVCHAKTIDHKFYPYLKWTRESEKS